MKFKDLFIYSEFFKNVELTSEETSEYHLIWVKNIIALGVSLLSLSYTLEYSKRFDSYKSIYGKIAKFAFIGFLPILISEGVKFYYFYPFYEKVYFNHQGLKGLPTLEEKSREKTKANSD